MLLSTSTGIKLDGDGYVDIIIAIGAKVSENNRLIDNIKDMISEGSFYLFHALDKKVYFKEATILVPSHWSCKGCGKARTESFEKAKIKVDYADSDDPYTNQYDECGKQGNYIHFTPNFLLSDTAVQTYGLRGKVFVHEWAHLRWGVYDETNENKAFYYSNGRIEATRCSKNIEGQYFSVSDGGSLQTCQIDPITLLPDKTCKFFPNKNQNTDISLMFLPSLDSVTTFCRENDHNSEAPSQQNIKCGNDATWTTIFETSVDKNHLSSLPSQDLTHPPNTTFKVVQRTNRVLCLILDVSGSMHGNRILLLQQAATLFLRTIIEEKASVGIVTFSSQPNTLSQLTVIDSDDTREHLIRLLPTSATGSTEMCLGLQEGLKVLQGDNGDALGDEIIFLTDGQATDNIDACVPSAIQSGAIISTLAFSKDAVKALLVMAEQTGGKFILSNDVISSNQLMDAFASLTLSTGDYTKEPVQLESAGTTTSNWFNGTVSVDQTIGTKTSFTITYETKLPRISIQSPSGLIYSQTQMHHDEPAKTVTLKVPGTAQTGDWKYSILSPTLQSLTVTATSQAARANVPPITVKAQMNQQFSDGSKPMIVFAEVVQNYKPLIKAEVWATLESESGTVHELQLLDNGAGADTFKDDGVYSRYFTRMKKGRSSLKVRVKNKDGQARFTLQKRGGAPYVPGYVVNGVVELNPPKLSVSEELPEVGSFTRTATGESFEVSLTSSKPPKFPPCKIIDLSAEIQEDAVLLSWTAPGEDLDEGSAKSYDIRWSFEVKDLLFNFSNAHVVNTSVISPQVFGSVEQHLFNLSFPIQNGTILFFAIQSEDNEKLKSEMSNVASGLQIIPNPNTGDLDLKLIFIAISVCLASVVVIGIFGITTWALTRKKLSDS
nr:epithelial chloride channel protein-like isoform X2 [Danio rerio]|eukprot:XP_021328580.1 epithelial chloride channel protein-like isoform X2 [Danio rerio]